MSGVPAADRCRLQNSAVQELRFEFILLIAQFTVLRNLKQ